jgi:hypothetical protein
LGVSRQEQKILDVGAQRINLLIANTNSLLCNVGTVATLTSSEIHTDNVYCLANLVSQGKLVGNTGTFNSVLSNLFTVSTLTTSDSFCGNIFVTGNLQTSGNVSMAQANITSLVGQTATLTGNLTLGNVLSSAFTRVSNTGIVSNSLSIGATSINPSGNLTAPWSNIVSMTGQTATLTGNLILGNNLSNSFAVLSNAGIVCNSLSIGATFINPSGNLTAPWSNIVSMTGQTATLTGNLILGNNLSNSFAVLSNAGIVCKSLSIGATSINPSGNLTAPWSNIVSMTGQTATLTGNLILGNNLSNSFAVLSNGSLSVGNVLSNTFGFSSISAAGVISNSLSVSNGTYVINASGIFQRAGNTYSVYANLVPYAQLSQLSQVATSSLTSIAGTTLQVAGNVSGDYLFGNASQLTGLTNSQLPSSINVTSVSTSGNITGAYLFGNASQLTGLPTNTFTGVLNNNQLPAAINVPGSIVSNTSLSTAGNVTSNYLFGNASQLTGIRNAQLPSTIGFNTVLANTSVLIGTTASLSGALVSGTLPAGNLTTPVPTLVSNASVQTGGFFIGDGSFVSNIRPTNINGSIANALLPTSINVPGSIISNTSISTSGNVSASYFLGNIQNASSIQNSQLPQNPTFSGTAQASAFYTTGSIITTGSLFGNISECNGLKNSQLPPSLNVPATINSNSSITATGNISTPLFVNAGYFFGNGSQLTGLSNSQLPSNISCNYLTCNTSFLSTGAATLSGLHCGNINLSRGVGTSFSSIVNCDTITSNVGAFPGWAQANTYWLASTQAWGGATGTGTSTYMVSGNLGASSYFGGTTSAAMPIILANCSLYTWGFLFGDGAYVSNIRGTALQTQINNNRLPTNASFGGTLQANGATTLGSTLSVSGNLQFSSGAYLNNPGVAGNGVSIIWGGSTNQSTFAFQSDTNIVAYNKTGAAVWATGAINSDRKYKKNIRDFGNVSNILRSIRARKFQYTDDMANTDQVGFVVDEIQAYIPEVIQPITNPDTDLTNNLVRYEKLSPYLVQAFQELDARVTALERGAKK